MKKFSDKVLSASADVILVTILASAGLPSIGGSYQPKEPAGLQKLAEESKKSENVMK
ncbi:MAG: hypothetical protein Q4G53_07575 [Clostridia bacterium]|nr:hypothetical protein [Clostridia bacterium]